MILFDDEVARRFLVVFGFWLFLALTYVLEKYVCYKICSSEHALSNKKKLSQLSTCQYRLIESDILPKTFATFII